MEKRLERDWSRCEEQLGGMAGGYVRSMNRVIVVDMETGLEPSIYKIQTTDLVTD